MDIINQHLRENIAHIEKLRKEISTKTNENESLQLQLKLTTQEIDYLKKLKDVQAPELRNTLGKAPHQPEENKAGEDSLFGKSILGVSSIHELQSFLEVFIIKNY